MLRRHLRLQGESESGRGRTPGGAAVSARRLLGAHLPAASAERRETVAGECLGCRTPFAVDVRLPLPAACPDCGADVLTRADIEGPASLGRPAFNAPRVRDSKQTRWAGNGRVESPGRQRDGSRVRKFISLRFSHLRRKEGRRHGLE